MATKRKQDCTPAEWEEIRAKRRAHYAANKARYREYARKYYLKWKESNPAAYKKAVRKWREEQKRWAQENRAYKRVQGQLRQAAMTPEAKAARIQYMREYFKSLPPEKRAEYAANRRAARKRARRMLNEHA